MRYLWVGLGGLLGALARYWLGGIIADRWVGAFPAGTFIINVSGSFLLGLVAGLGTERGVLAPELRTALGVGFLGAYTTFSTWTLETLRLLQAGSIGLALWNIIGSAGAGLAGAWLGLAVARL